MVPVTLDSQINTHEEDHSSDEEAKKDSDSEESGEDKEKQFN